MSPVCRESNETLAGLKIKKRNLRHWRTLGGAKGGASPPNNIYSSFSFEKWKHTKVFILKSGTVAYYLVHHFALLLSWLQQFVRLCVTLIVQSSDIIYKSASGD